MTFVMTGFISGLKHGVRTEMHTVTSGTLQQVYNRVSYHILNWYPFINLHGGKENTGKKITTTKTTVTTTPTSSFLYLRVHYSKYFAKMSHRYRLGLPPLTSQPNSVELIFNTRFYDHSVHTWLKICQTLPYPRPVPPQYPRNSRYEGELGRASLLPMDSLQHRPSEHLQCHYQS